MAEQPIKTYTVQALTDSIRHIGIVNLSAKKGDELELEGDQVEMALSTGAFKLKPETPASYAEKTKKDDLLRQAEGFGIETAGKMTKEALAKEILQKEKEGATQVVGLNAPVPEGGVDAPGGTVSLTNSNLPQAATGIDLGTSSVAAAPTPTTAPTTALPTALPTVGRTNVSTATSVGKVTSPRAARTTKTTVRTSNKTTNK